MQDSFERSARFYHLNLGQMADYVEQRTGFHLDPVNFNRVPHLRLDEYCQGIKDTYWYFNISPSDYKSFREEMSEHQSMETIPYVLAHNIIFAAHEYAPECGEDGIPVFMSSPGTSDTNLKALFTHLPLNIFLLWFNFSY